ncbi:hypothetical protein WJX84_006804 [Apatococcus fuscideae]|uniref:Uncharacterized protein n=1 Tax=Apatococcus fuscideae TaxID=2026836 RepID=A0AAW1T0S6_9CHLO
MIILEKFRVRCHALKAQGQQKEDMVVNKQMKAEKGVHVLDMHGHIPGIVPGDTFRGKGELAVLGIHRSIPEGIHWKKGKPAFAICLSGRYIDDRDQGRKFDYTGSGGQDKKGRQIKDQKWERGNICLRTCVERRMPVRVIRGKRDRISNELTYTYDGMYMVNKACIVVGADNFKVCSFEMEAIEAHATVSPPVAFRSLGGGVLSRRTLRDSAAGALAVAPANPQATRRLKKRRGLLIKDLAVGQEHVPIPVFNEIDDTQLPPLQYIRQNTWATREAEAVHQSARAVLRTCGRCGVAACHALGMTEFYTEQGELQTTVPEGVYECPPNCMQPACQHNRVVTRGLTLPLEVFYTGPERGWGVRCQTAIPTGTFICEYVGEVMTDSQAEELRHTPGHDAYLFNLDHFLIMHQELESKGAGAERTTLPTLPYDAALPKNWDKHPQRLAHKEANEGQELPGLEDNDPYLVIDARVTGGCPAAQPFHLFIPSLEN